MKASDKEFIAALVKLVLDHGYPTENSFTKTNGQQITVRLGTGDVLTITLEAKG